MFIRFGYEIGIHCEQPTPMMTYLSIDRDRRHAVVSERGPIASPAISMSEISDPFGNTCMRMVVPEGGVHLSYDAVIRDSGAPDPVNLAVQAVPVEKLPAACLPYLSASRYCETDRFGSLAWRLFGEVEPGWARVQAICDYVHERLLFSYGYAATLRTAMEAHDERVGVSRDYAHLAVTLCRAMNMPARYVNGYMGDIGVPENPAPMDFNAWFEVYLGDRWYTFDARNNEPRIGRIAVARGRDAADIPLIQTFGKHELTTFTVWTCKETDAALTHSHKKADVSLVTPWFSERWTRHVQEREHQHEQDHSHL
ncbi:transglutaminase family protein [Rhizobium sp. 32-5/1]|uniref:transglutaminase-like domain-containing protein n=1 Tax=Rhizobium sp. 32-5/1 TaxID=3019602 RepID=UPI00240CE711|nr:transglutaminase family protein [Rhizobium sp. 32-5/1]WEZ82751.1 transglutaminase family protein [Rhizobium sp. 32-5/1]